MYQKPCRVVPKQGFQKIRKNGSKVRFESDLGTIFGASLETNVILS